MEQLHALNALLEMHQHQFYVNNVSLTAQLATIHLHHVQLVLQDISLMAMVHVHYVQLEQPLIYLSAINV